LGEDFERLASPLHDVGRHFAQLLGLFVAGRNHAAMRCAGERKGVIFSRAKHFQHFFRQHHTEGIADLADFQAGPGGLL